MRKRVEWSVPVLLLLSLVLSGCGGESADDPLYIPAEIDDVSTCAVSYKDVADITLNIKDQDGNLNPMANGDVVGSGMKILSINVSPKRDGERVFVSDGGTKITEAVLNDAGMYECTFTFYPEEYNAYPLLIQVLYENGYASKRKYVLATNTDYKAGNGSLVKHGLGIIVGEDLLAGMNETIANLFNEALSTDAVKIDTVVVHTFKPADNESNNGQEGVFNADADVPLAGLLNVIPGIGEILSELFGPLLDNFTPNLNMDLAVTDTEDGERGLNITLEDLHINGLSLNLPMSFSMPPVAADLGDMLGGLGGEDEDDLLGSILGNLELDKFMFVNAFGRPEETTAEYAALGAGLYVAEGKDVDMDGGNNPVFPEVVEDETNGKISLEPIIPRDDFNMGVALSLYNLNQVLEGIAGGLTISLDAASLPIPLAIPKRTTGIQQVVEISPNRNGLVVSLNADGSVRMDIVDLGMEYIEGGAVKWRMSLDMVLDLGVGVSLDEQGRLCLALTLEPVESLCHTHVMKDNMGICIFDKSDFIITLFKTLSQMMAGDGEVVQADTPFSVSIPLDSFLTPKTGVQTAGNVMFDETGDCFMNLAVDTIETGSLCFISSASEW